MLEATTEPRGMGKIISIANQKGGVGKTTTAINLAASLSVAQKRCLLVDCDPQGNATTGLGFERAAVTKGVYDLIMGDGWGSGIILETLVPDLYLIGSTTALVGAEVEIAGLPYKEFRLRDKLRQIKRDYDFILVDCPPSLGFLTINALVCADEVLVPLQCEYYALEGLSQLITTIKAVKRSLNPNIKLGGILLTMFDVRNNLSLQVREEVRRHFKSTVFQTVIPRNVRLSEAPSHGKPVLLYDVRSKGAQSYLALAQEILRKAELP